MFFISPYSVHVKSKIENSHRFSSCEQHVLNSFFYFQVSFIYKKNMYEIGSVYFVVLENVIL